MRTSEAAPRTILLAHLLIFLMTGFVFDKRGKLHITNDLIFDLFHVP